MSCDTMICMHANRTFITTVLNDVYFVFVFFSTNCNFISTLICFPSCAVDFVIENVHLLSSSLDALKIMKIHSENEYSYFSVFIHG